MTETRYNGKYNNYAETIAQIAMEHQLLVPGEENAFTKYVRGC